MKIAVIGGNLLGCATTLDLALIQETDARVYGPSDDPFQVTLFERADRLGGNSFRSVQIDDTLTVEVGSHRTLAVHSGTYLADLVDCANDERATQTLFGYRFKIPGAVVARRGARNAARLVKPWEAGSYGRVVRSFAAWDWKDDAYHLIHAGWPLLDMLHRLLDNAIWRSVAFAGVLWAVRVLQRAKGFGARGLALAQCVVMLGVFLFSPRRVVAMWQRQYTFWSTTLSLLFAHGITVAISRGSSIGFIRHLAEMNKKNAATCSVSTSSLIHRAGFDPYLRGSGDDYTRKFKYDRKFVNRYLAPVVAYQYAGARLGEVSSLASHFALLHGDYANSDVTCHFVRIVPENARLCTAIIDAARATMPVDVRLSNYVRSVVFDEDTMQYRITSKNGQSELFDGIVLCAVPRGDEMSIETPVSSSLSELFGYDRDVTAAEGHIAQEAEYHSQQRSAQQRDTEGPTAPSACSHIAVVVGTANPLFFRLTDEESIPDLVQLTHAPGVSFFERIRPVQPDVPGVYTVLCGPDFQTSGIRSEMFEETAEVRSFRELSESSYTHNPLPASMDIDEYMPYVVLGNRFVYAAATDKLAKHPELDAISAVNAASLFSKAVHWAQDGSETSFEERSSQDSKTD